MNDLIQFIQIENELKSFSGLLPEANNYKSSEYIKIGVVDTEKQLPVGILVLTIQEEQVEIEYLLVASEYRFQGIGSRLLEIAKQITMSYSKEAHALLSLSCAFDTTDEELYRFFCERADMEISYEGYLYTLTPEYMRTSRMIQKISDIRKADMSFNARGSIHQKKYIKELLLADPDLTKDDIVGLSMELSQVEMVDNKIVGCLLAKVREDGDVDIDYVYSNSKYSTLFGMMLANAYYKVKKYYPLANIHFTIMNRNVGTQRKFSKLQPIGSLCVARWNYLPQLSSEQVEKLFIEAEE